MIIKSYLDYQSIGSNNNEHLLTDNFHREIKYLRLSLTEQCNLRCIYCLPNGYKPGTKSKPDYLSTIEIVRLVRGFVQMGVKKVRLTGGEPTLRRDLIEIIEAIREVQQELAIGLSTNGVNLKSQASRLAESGVNALNVSLDSLNASRFHRLTGMDVLHRVLAGVESAIDTGKMKVKINAVLFSDTDQNEIAKFLGFVKSRPVVVRFIELMETKGNQTVFGSQHISSKYLASFLISHGWTKVERGALDGPAFEYTHQDYIGRIGLIAPYEPSFCENCNRLRVNAYGDLLLCLYAQKGHSLRQLIQSEEQILQLKTTLRNLLNLKSFGHQLHTNETGGLVNFSQIGG